jgi:hypothetical protein
MRRQQLWVCVVCMALVLWAGCSDDEGGNPSGGTSGGDTSGSASGADTQADTSGGTSGTGEDTSGGTSGTGDDTSGGTSGTGDDTSGGTSGTSGDTSGSDTSGGTSGTSGDTSGGDTSGGNTCDSGLLCGQPVQCCAVGSECVQGQCLTTCDSGVRCGANREVCCGADQVCVAQACASPQGTCLDSYDCQPGQFCEPTLGQCLPQPEGITCQIIPVFSDVTAEVEWSFTDHDIISIPLVADLTGDATPEVVVNATQTTNWPSGEVVVLNGATGNVLWRNGATSSLPSKRGAHGRSTLALGDVSGDGRPDILYAARPADTAGNGGPTPICAMDGDGVELWCSHTAAGVAVTFDIENGAISAANFDDDPHSEVVVGASLIDHDGVVLWNEGGDGSIIGTNSSYRGGVSAIADLDGDGKPEIISGRQAWKVEWPSSGFVGVNNLWAYGDATFDGYPAVADFDGDGAPEVVVVSRGRVLILQGNPSPGQLNAAGALWCGGDATGVACDGGQARAAAITIPGGGIGGPPTISDFDGDGRPEVGVAGGGSYSVYDVNRPLYGALNVVEDIPAGATPAAPEPWQLFIRWSQATQDLSSNATGSSVFDFQGDGQAEVVYADECFMRVYSGSDGQVQLQVPSTNATIHEYPLVVDVDGDGNSEILIVATNSPGSCPAGNPARKGLYVYGDTNDQWVPTRRVWTQHTYHVTNATSAGLTPVTEANSWQAAGLNNYRQNVQGEGVFNAPDLTLDLSVSLRLCAQQQLELRASVSNNGALGVPAGVTVQFYLGDDAGGASLGSAITTEPLLPGASTTVTLAVPQPAAGATANFFATIDGQASTTIVECDNTNNDGRATTVSCTIN